jgi:hypothetical protein
MACSVAPRCSLNTRKSLLACLALLPTTQEFITIIRKKYAGTAAARLAAVVQHRHVAHHGKAIIDALGNQEANVNVQKAALNSYSSAPHLDSCTIDGRQSRLVCRHNAGTTPHPRDLAMA